MKKTAIKTVLTFAITTTAFGAGFERELMWSGRYSGMAGAVSSFVEGPQSLYFNAAGLLSQGEEAPVNQTSFNLSYLPSKFKGPVSADNDNKTSNSQPDFSGSALYSRQISSDLAFGFGVYPVGGTSSEFDTVDFGGGVSGKPKASLKVIELGTGIAYRATPELSFGLAYRITYATAEFTSIDTTSPVQPAIFNFKDLKGWDFFSFRGGAQYKKENWGMGFSFRSPVIFKVKGKLEGITTLVGAVSADHASISSTFPLTIALGGHYKVTPNFTVLAEYNFFNYSKTDDLAIDANASVMGRLRSKSLKWKDGHLFRLGANYTMNQWNFSTGYLYGTAVTNKETADATTEPPAAGHIFTLGSGYAFSKTLRADLSLDYGFSQVAKVSGSTTTLDGKYSVSGFGIHTGLDWNF